MVSSPTKPHHDLQRLSQGTWAAIMRGSAECIACWAIEQDVGTVRNDGRPATLAALPMEYNMPANVALMVYIAANCMLHWDCLASSEDYTTSHFDGSKNCPTSRLCSISKRLEWNMPNRIGETGARTFPSTVGRTDRWTMALTRATPVFLR